MSEVVSTMIDAGTVVFAALAICISVVAYRNAKKGQQFNIVDKFLTELGQIDTEVANLHRMYYETKNYKLLASCLDQMLAKLFNKLDWICYLINKQQINDESLLKYIYPVIKGHYEKTYTESASDAMKKDTEYENFKKLYEKIKDELKKS